MTFLRRAPGATIPSLMLAFLLLLPACTAAPAAESLRVTRSDARSSFPNAITFNFDAVGPADINRILLEYRVKKSDRIPVISVISPKVQPSRKISTNWTWQMNKTGGLPPGSEIEYRWRIEDAARGKLDSPFRQIAFNDTRFSWNDPISAMSLSIYYYKGDGAFGAELAAAAGGAIDNLSKDMGLTLGDPGKLYIYASSRDLQSGLIFPQEWTGGVAFRDYNTIALAISPKELEWGRRAIAHELTHLAMFQKTQEAYGNLPTWFNEGMATFSEGGMKAETRRLLDRAITTDRLISVKSLVSPFPANADEARLSYAESESILGFLVKSYGTDRVRGLLASLEDGLNFNAAFKLAYGFSADDLDTKWRASLMN